MRVVVAVAVAVAFVVRSSSWRWYMSCRLPACDLPFVHLLVIEHVEGVHAFDVHLRTLSLSLMLTPTLVHHTVFFLEGFVEPADVTGSAP